MPWQERMQREKEEAEDAADRERREAEEAEAEAARRKEVRRAILGRPLGADSCTGVAAGCRIRDGHGEQ